MKNNLFKLENGKFNISEGYGSVKKNKKSLNEATPTPERAEPTIKPASSTAPPPAPTSIDPSTVDSFYSQFSGMEESKIQDIFDKIIAWGKTKGVNFGLDAKQALKTAESSKKNPRLDAAAAAGLAAADNQKILAQQQANIFMNQPEIKNLSKDAFIKRLEQEIKTTREKMNKLDPRSAELVSLSAFISILQMYIDDEKKSRSTTSESRYYKPRQPKSLVRHPSLVGFIR